MFCSKCGKEIDNDATFCGFCGNPTDVTPTAADASQTMPQQAVSQQTIPQQAVSQQTIPQQAAPQQTIPQPTASQQASFQQTAPQFNTPQYGAPSSDFNLNLDPKLVDIINKGLRAVLIILSLLMFIGAIGAMASVGSMISGSTGAAALGLLNFSSFVGLARVPAIIAFSLSVLGLAFTILTKQKSLFSYISAGIGTIMFIFNFVMYGGIMSFRSFITSYSTYWGLTSGPNISGIIVSGIFLILCAVAMIAASLVIILKKEDIIKFRPKF